VQQCSSKTPSPDPSELSRKDDTQPWRGQKFGVGRTSTGSLWGRWSSSMGRAERNAIRRDLLPPDLMKDLRCGAGYHRVLVRPQKPCRRVLREKPTVRAEGYARRCDLADTTIQCCCSRHRQMVAYAYSCDVPDKVERWCYDAPIPGIDPGTSFS